MNSTRKVLVLINDIYYQFNLEKFKHTDICFMPMLSSDTENGLYRAIRKIHLNSNLPLRNKWFYEWEKVIEEYDTIILGDAGNSYNVSRYIKQKYQQKRVIIWYRNTITAYNDPSKYDRRLCELWTFDLEDSKKYDMYYNHQFYIPRADYRECCPLKYDVFFVGEEKGRGEQLKSIDDYLNSHGFVTKFCIVGLNSERITYDEVLKYIGESKAILDIQISTQNGITLRPLEALFFNKKLITNSPSLGEMFKNGFKNLYIIDDLKYEGLDTFLSAGIQESEMDLREEYSVAAWIKRFDVM